MRICALVDRETGEVLKLIGLDVRIAKDVKEDFRKIVEEGDVGIVITTYEILDLIKREIEKNKQAPLIIPIPDKKKKMSIDIFKDLIKRTVGIEIKIGR